jgi:hypothetical protein
MAREVCSSAPLSGEAPFLRPYRLGWGLVCRVSAVSRGRSPGNCFPQVEPQFFVNSLIFSNIKLELARI